MKITLDTNILVQDFWLESPHTKVFLDELNIIPGTLYIPEIVIDETVNKYREFLNEKAEDKRKVNSDISRLLKKEIGTLVINVEQATNDYKKFLIDKFKSVKVRVLPYPQLEHKEVVKQILERRKPFKKGDAGYRDFLIWQTIKKLETWGTEEIVFITNNIKDFGDSGILFEEFSDKTTSNKNFKISATISRFNDEYILPRLKKMDDLKLKLAKGEVLNFDFKNWLDTEFTDFIKEVDFEEVLVGFPYGVGRVKADEILFYDDYKIGDVVQLNSGEKLVHFNVKCNINANIDIKWSDYVNHKEVREYYGGSTEEFNYSSGMVSGKIEVEGYFILDKQNEDVKEFEVTSLDGPGGCIDMGV